MSFQLLNPVGAIAFVALAAVLAIHMLQRRSRTLRIATRFLLPPAPRAGRAGTQLERLRRSPQMWWQLAAAALMALLLCRPVWRSDLPVQRMAVVLDESASMSAFLAETRAALDALRNRISGAPGRFELILSSSSDGRPLEDAGRGALPASYRPVHRSHDPAPALSQARQMAGRGGAAVFLTDGVTDPTGQPDGVYTLAVGRKLENSGFAGATTNADGWQVWICNWGAAPLTRSVMGPTGEIGNFDLAPGTLATVSGTFSAENIPVVLALEAVEGGPPDPFPLDDRTILMRPVPRPIAVAFATDPAHEALARRLNDALPAISPAADPAAADLVWVSYDPLDPKWVMNHGIVFLHDTGTARGNVAIAHTIPEDDPIVEGLPINTLVAAQSLRIPVKNTDRVLAWQGDAPILFIRSGGAARQLVFNFDPGLSNLGSQAWAPLLIHRFVQTLRRDLPGTERVSVYTGESLDVPGPGPWAIRSDSDTVEHRSTPVRAPTEPGPFEVNNRNGLVISGAARFDDPWESDFRTRTSSSVAEVPLPEAMDRTPATLPFEIAAAMALLACAIVSWAVGAHPARK